MVLETLTVNVVFLLQSHQETLSHIESELDGVLEAPRPVEVTMLSQQEQGSEGE